MLRHPDPIETDGKTLDQIRAAIYDQIRAGYSDRDIRLLTGTLAEPITFSPINSDGEPMTIERLRPGMRVCEALVV